MSVYRPEFEAALRLFAAASEALVARGFSRPILVGGAAVELYTLGAVTTGDFDVVTSLQSEFEDELRRLGFTKPSGPGHTPLGCIHPELQLGFEVVGSALLDGATDPDRVILLDFGAKGTAAIIAIEDIIADRMGQYASGSAPEMLGQARRLFDLHLDADLAYMDGRIRYEPVASMALQTFKRNQPIPFETFATEIARRRDEAGVTDIPRNAGNRRTPSKRALLAAIEKSGGRW